MKKRRSEKKISIYIDKIMKKTITGTSKLMTGADEGA